MFRSLLEAVSIHQEEGSLTASGWGVVVGPVEMEQTVSLPFSMVPSLSRILCC